MHKEWVQNQSTLLQPDNPHEIHHAGLLRSLTASVISTTVDGGEIWFDFWMWTVQSHLASKSQFPLILSSVIKITD